MAVNHAQESQAVGGTLTNVYKGELIRLGTQNRVFDRLDWWQPAEWMGADVFCCLTSGSHVDAAMLAVPTILNETRTPDNEKSTSAWLRWCGVSDGVSASRSLKQLFEYCETRWRNVGLSDCYCLVEPGHWFGHYLHEDGYSLHDRIITMVHRLVPRTLPVIPSHRHIAIRAAHADDISAIYEVDDNAFDDIWRFPRVALARALQQSAYISVATAGDCIVGYQITTLTDEYAHITRLAVHRDHQSQGIGRLLLTDTMSRMYDWHGIQQFTLNTQASNSGSQMLYRSIGFRIIQPQIKVLHKSLIASGQHDKHIPPAT